MIVLYCPSTSELKLGPNSDIVFHEHFASFEEDAHPGWEAWANHPTTPPIEVLPEDQERVAPAEFGGLTCPICAEKGEERSFGSKAGLQSHLRSHAR
jgi:hypothetical protein